MSGSANVRSIDSLRALSAELARFRQEAREALSAADREMRRTLEWLKNVRARWLAEVRRRAEALELAVTALRHCMASGGGESGPPDCSAQQQDVALARRRLDEALAEVRRIDGLIAELEEVANGFLREAVRLRATLDGDVPAAGALLNRKVETLRAYLSIGGLAGFVSGSGGAPAAGGGGGDGGISGGGGGSHNGVEVIPLDRIDPTDWASGADLAFEKVSREDVAGGIERLESVVRPAVDQGADGDYFDWLDSTSSLDREHGYRRIYDAFYGDDAIRLGRVGPLYEVINGRHRLFVARQLGLSSIVARVVGSPGDGR